jgi:chromate reductase
MPLRILAICGSLRRNSYNLWTLGALAELAPAADMALQIVRLNGIPVFNQDDLDADGYPAIVQQFQADIEAADGIIICTPEYNHSYSGALKNAIDWLPRKPPIFGGKSMAIVSVATSPMGGSRAQYDLRKVLQPLDPFVLNTPEVFVGQAQSKFDAEGQLTDAATRTQLEALLSAFHTWILRLRAPVPISR